MSAMTPQLNVLVTGATGKQGGAAARALLAGGHRVKALTRKPESAAAQELKGLGAELVTGTFDDRASLEQAMRGADTVFAMGTPYEAGVEAEIRQGLTIVEAVTAASPKHVVLMSVASANQQTGIPHFDSKFTVEEALRRSGLPFTILAPVYFMENLFAPWNLDSLKKGVYAQPLPAGRKLQQIAVADIGAFAAHVIGNRDRFLGQRIDLASDELTGQEMLDIVSKASGKEIRYQEVPLEAARANSADLAAMFEWFDRVGYSADSSALRRIAPDVGWHRYGDWAREQDWTPIR